MNAKDFEIYQEIAKVAAAVFENIQCAPAAPVAPVAPIVIACFGN